MKTEAHRQVGFGSQTSLSFNAGGRFIDSRSELLLSTLPRSTVLVCVRVYLLDLLETEITKKHPIFLAIVSAPISDFFRFTALNTNFSSFSHISRGLLHQSH